MIRIDELYYSTFLTRVQTKHNRAIHWFDPFGSTDINDLCSTPAINNKNNDAVRYLFWDQEPVHLDIVEQFMPTFVDVYDGHIHFVTSEYQSNNVATVCNTYNLTPQYYFFHGWAALDWYRGYNRTFLSTPYNQRAISHTFLCPNNIIGGRRKHRLELFSQLVNNNLINNNLISFPDRCPFEHQTTQELCRRYGIELGSVDLPLRIDSGANYQARSHCIDMWNLSATSLVQVVTETVYDGTRQHLTEKTFKPIAMSQPFILVSCQGSLEYLRRYGFKTFGEFWDESYDQADDASRIEKITQLLVELNNLSTKEKQQLHRAMQSTVEHNYNHFYSGTFENNYLWPELTAMLESMDV